MQDVNQWAEDIAREARRAVFFATLKIKDGKAIISEHPPALIYSANLAAQWRVGPDRTMGRINQVAKAFGWPLVDRNTIELRPTHMQQLAREAVAFWMIQGYSTSEARPTRPANVLQFLEIMKCPDWAKGVSHAE